jgi:ABC-type phosphate transport system auxiliary subunit
MKLGDLKTWATDKVDRADSGQTTPNRDDYTPITSRLSNAGIRVEPLNEGKLAKRIVGKYKGQIEVLKRRLRKLKANTGVDEVSKQRQMDAIKADIRKKTAALKRRLNGE